VFEAHIRHDAPKPGFLRIDFSSDRRRETTVFRVVELAESLFNLQHIEGFDACIAQMIGELKNRVNVRRIGLRTILIYQQRRFSLCSSADEEGSDYDVEVFYPDGFVVPADAKCKFETTEINPQSILHSLKKAKKQLPDDRPCIIFMKVPRAGSRRRNGCSNG